MHKIKFELIYYNNLSGNKRRLTVEMLQLLRPFSELKHFENYIKSSGDLPYEE